MTNDEIRDRYRRTQDTFDAVLREVPPDRWTAASACELWTVQDVVGHVIWGLEVLRHHATGQEYTERTGPPGSEEPGELAGDDPLAGWRAARDAVDAVLTDEMLDGPAPPRFAAARPDATLADQLEVSTFDTLVHTWDVGSALGIPMSLDPDAVARSFTIARLIMVRSPSTFGPKLKPPPGADPEARLLAFVGRPV